MTDPDKKKDKYSSSLCPTPNRLGGHPRSFHSVNIQIDRKVVG